MKWATPGFAWRDWGEKSQGLALKGTAVWDTRDWGIGGAQHAFQHTMPHPGGRTCEAHQLQAFKQAFRHGLANLSWFCAGTHVISLQEATSMHPVQSRYAGASAHHEIWGYCQGTSKRKLECYRISECSSLVLVLQVETEQALPAKRSMAW